MFSSSKTFVAFVACVALPACSSITADDDGVDYTEDALGVACSLGSTCPASVPLLDARSFGDERPPADLVGDLEVVHRGRGQERVPRRFAEATSPLMMYVGGSVLLSSDPVEHTPIRVDDILLFEFVDEAGKVLGRRTYGERKLRHLGAAIDVIAPRGTAGVAAFVDLGPALPRNQPFRIRLTALDIGGRAETTAVFLRPDTNTSGPLIDFTWSTRGPIRGLHCINIDEPAAVTSSTQQMGPGARTGVSWDARAGYTRWTDGPWRDNYLCTKGDHGLRWSNAGPIDGMVCTNINEPAAPAEYTWADNYLCAPRDYHLAWSSAGPLPGHVCTQISEPNQLSWDDNYLCQERR